jgi:hypothetical protein
MGQSTPPDPPTTNGLRRLVLIWAVLFGSLMVFAAAKSEPTDGPVAPTFGEFLVDLDRGRIEHVDLRTRDNSARVEARGDWREGAASGRRARSHPFERIKALTSVCAPRRSVSVGSPRRANGASNEWSGSLDGASLESMTPLTHRPMLTRRAPATSLYEHAAGVLAAARGLEAESRDPEAAPAIGPTLACIEAALDAVAEATTRLGDHVVERCGEPDSASSAASADAVDAFRRLRASLERSSAACLHARAATHSVSEDGGAGADETCG